MVNRRALLAREVAGLRRARGPGWRVVQEVVKHPMRLKTTLVTLNRKGFHLERDLSTLGSLEAIDAQIMELVENEQSVVLSTPERYAAEADHALGRLIACLRAVRGGSVQRLRNRTLWSRTASHDDWFAIFNELASEGYIASGALGQHMDIDPSPEATELILHMRFGLLDEATFLGLGATFLRANAAWAFADSLRRDCA